VGGTEVGDGVVTVTFIEGPQAVMMNKKANANGSNLNLIRKYFSKLFSLLDFGIKVRI
jgi:hypothetical protein